MCNKYQVEDNKDNWRQGRCQLQYSQLATLTNARIGMDTVILLENGHLHHAKAEVEDVVDGVIVDNVKYVVDDEEGDVPAPKDQLMPR